MMSTGGFRVESNAVLEQKAHHGHEGDALVAIDECVIFRQAKCISCRKFGHV